LGWSCDEQGRPIYRGHREHSKDRKFRNGSNWDVEQTE
jgi:hypothetical protein